MATRRPKVYHTVEQLGAGSFGEVFLVTKTPPSRNWEMAAMKVIQSPGGNAFQEVDFFKAERNIFVSSQTTQKKAEIYANFLAFFHAS